MKTITNKLVMSVLALVLTGVALSVGVFAWFTVNNRANIDSFTGTVQTGEGFYVSTDAQSWVNEIDSATMQILAEDVIFRAMTSEDGITFEEYNSLTALTAATDGFIEFTLYFAGSAALDQIQVSSLTLTGSQTSWIPGRLVSGTRQASESLGANDPITDYVSNAARVSFEDILGTFTSVIFEQADTVDGNSLGFDTYTTNEAILFYNDIMDTPIPEVDFDAAVLNTASTSKAGTNLTVPVASLVDLATFNALPGITADTTELSSIGGDDAAFGAITIRVWVEGFDQEAFNAILSGLLTVEFNFVGIDTTP
ncbi:MAG: hypothetical protein WCZ19_05535 [Acholeplasma sp.]